MVLINPSLSSCHKILPFFLFCFFEVKGWGFCLKFFSPFSPVWPAADSFSFSPAFNASWVELWNKHQEVKKQKSLEKTSKDIKKNVKTDSSSLPITANSPGAGWACIYGTQALYSQEQKSIKKVSVKETKRICLPWEHCIQMSLLFFSFLFFSPQMLPSKKRKQVFCILTNQINMEEF